ncbi:MAG: acyl carrier protein [Clostridia bacterium]|nr:acyl carrier protein [Clostridia bacterium]
MNPTIETLKDLFQQVFEGEIPCKELNEETRLIEDLGMNSIGLLYMAMSVENTFNIQFQNTDFDHLRTVGDVVMLIESRI